MYIEFGHVKLLFCGRYIKNIQSMERPYSIFFTKLSYIPE